MVDDLPASKRRGLNRVVWSMRDKPPRVPPAAQLAFAGTQGPRVLPGTYTVRMTKGGEVYEAKFEVGLDRRATYTLADSARSNSTPRCACTRFSARRAPASTASWRACRPRGGWREQAVKAATEEEARGA